MGEQRARWTPGWAVVLGKRVIVIIREKSCGALVYRKKQDKYELLLIKHRYGGHWSFPKGHVEQGENELQTALREIKEETGLDLLTVNDILPLSYSAIGFANETNLCIVGVADGTFSKSSSTVEEIKAGWYTKDEVKKLLKTELFAARTQSYCYLWCK